MLYIGPKKQKYSYHTNIVCYGNSIWHGDTLADPATQAWPALIASIWPLTSTGATIENCGQSGWSWAMLGGNNAFANGGGLATVNAAWKGGRRNILILGENTNSLMFGPASTYAPVFNYPVSSIKTDAITCINNLLAVFPWTIVLVATIPLGIHTFAPYTGDITQLNTLNANNNILNQWLLTEYRSLGAAMAIDWQPPKSPFNLPDYSVNTFLSTGIYSPDAVHPNSIGHQVLAKITAPQLARLNA